MHPEVAKRWRKKEAFGIGRAAGASITLFAAISSTITVGAHQPCRNAVSQIHKREMDDQDIISTNTTRMAMSPVTVTMEMRDLLPKRRQNYMDNLFAKAKDAHVAAEATGSRVAHFNAALLEQLEARFAIEPEFDMTAVLDPKKYTKGLARTRKEDVKRKSKYRW